MYCRNCGNKLEAGVSFCPNCGQRVVDVFQGQKETAEGHPYDEAGANGNVGGARNSYGDAGGAQNPYGALDWNNDGQENPYADPVQNHYRQPAETSSDGFAIASLVLGILSFFILPIIGSILAIVFGNKSIRDTGVSTMARVGKILGVISLVIYVVVIVIFVIMVFAGIAMLSAYSL